MAKDALLVLSGGMDSTTMLWDYADDIAVAVTFQYGSNHNKREAECARWNCEKLGIEWIEIDLSFMGEYFKSSLLEGADAIPEGKAVMIANHSGDHAIYPDCRPGFIKAMGQAIGEGTYEHLELRAPYTGLTKGEIALRGKELGVDYSHTYSCYKGGEHHCGKCGTCVERREALEFAGITLENDRQNEHSSANEKET